MDVKGVEEIIDLSERAQCAVKEKYTDLMVCTVSYQSQNTLCKETKPNAVFLLHRTEPARPGSSFHS